MKNRFAWSRWSITSKIMFTFLALSVISMGVTSTIAIINIRTLGSYADNTSTALGERSITDSTAHLVALGEEIIKQKARDVGKQVEMYFKSHPDMTITGMRSDSDLRQIVVQPVGMTGYTTLIDPENAIIIIHKYPGQEKDISLLKDDLPSFWNLITNSVNQNEISGYYDWLEVDGSLSQKYATIVPVMNGGGYSLTIWATTYIDEFSAPVDEMENEIQAAILESRNVINDNVSRIQDLFLISFTILVIGIIGLALLLSKVITSPILALKQGAEAIGQGKLDYKLKIKSMDELGDLANEFNKMGSSLKKYLEELQNTSEENIIKEKRIQDNLRLYVQKIGEVQETERKKIARDLHDEIIQSLIVIARHLDDLAEGETSRSLTDVRKEIEKVIKELRHFSQELRPSILDDLGLIPAVKWLASDLAQNYNILLETEITGTQRQLIPNAELMLFRIIQEGLTNIGKHSEATKATIRIAYFENNIVVTIQDNGKGFIKASSSSELTRVGKLGLVGIQERAQLLGGTLNIESQPGKGTTLRVDVPL